MYRQIIETFASDAITSPTVESPRPHVSSFTPSISSQKYYSPDVELIRPENISPSVEEEVEQYEPETYHENEPYEPEYCALELFDDVEDESVENCSVEINLDQKRKQTSPIVAAVSSKKTRMTGEWQQNENELGQEFYVNQRTGQVVANVPMVAEEFLIRERRQFMPFGTSPIMQLAPSCELKMDEDVQQILNRAVEDNFNYSGDVAASLKWQSLDELAKERDKLGILPHLFLMKCKQNNYNLIIRRYIR
jgi:hypothetical protein